MKTRREFILQSAAAMASLGGGITIATDSLAQAAGSSHGARAESQIKRIVLRHDTVLRDGIIGAGAATWASNDLQYLSCGDAIGLSEPKLTYHSRIFTLSGDPMHPKFGDLPNYPNMLPLVPDEPRGPASYFPTGCLAVDGILYQYLMTPNHPYMDPDGTFPPDFRMTGVKMIYSPDCGQTWHNQDGSTPVVWEKWAERSRENMVFFNEKPDGAFTDGFNPIGLLQMGKGYELNKDGYIYGYSLNGINKPWGNQVVCFRVSKSDILDRRMYEFFAGMRSDGKANWTKDIAARAVLYSLPEGEGASGSFGGQEAHSSGWAVTPFYIEALQTFMFAGLRQGIDSQGRWFTKPSYLGLWTALTPWGPFKQVHEEASWTPGHDARARVDSIAVPPMWIAGDGRSFWIAWNDYQYKGDAGEDWNPDADLVPKLKGIADKPEGARLAEEWDEKHMRWNGFNRMRIDIIL